MIEEELNEGFLLICNELHDSEHYAELMELYNRATVISRLEGFLLIDDTKFEINVEEQIHVRWLLYRTQKCCWINSSASSWNRMRLSLDTERYRVL